MRKFILLVIISLTCFTGRSQYFQMTDELMDLPINEISFPSTHNTFNASNDGFALPNTHWTIEEQLERGIRGLEIDVHYQQTGIKPDDIKKRIYHSEPTNGILGSTSVDLQFGRIREFLEKNPNEILFLKIEKTISLEDLHEEFEENGLMQYFYQGDGEYIPTVRELVESGKRICGTNGVGEEIGWGFSYEGTPTGKDDPSEIENYDAMYNPPSPKQFWACNAYLEQDLLGTGSEDDAAYCNDYNWLLNYVTECWKLNGQKTWRLIVDFPSIGDVNSVANTLNSYKMLKGSVYIDGAVADSVEWNCQYSKGFEVNTWTHGNFNFPVQQDEKVIITPKLDGYRFHPNKISVNFDNFEGDPTEIQAYRIYTGSTKSSAENESLIDYSTNDQLKVYPIPARDELNVDLPATINEDVTIHMMNSSGSMVKDYGRFNTNSGTIKLNLNGLSRGWYVISINGSNYSKSTKIIIS